jgi:hypothetical protein
MAAEKYLETKIRKYAESKGALVFKYHGGAFSVAAFPDLFGIFPKDGRFWAIEIKAHKKKPTKAQLAMLEEIAAHNGLATWSDNFDDAKNFIDLWMS